MTIEKDRGAPGDGEQLHQLQRAGFWKLLGKIGVLGLVCGLVGGLALVNSESGTPLPPMLKLIGAAGVFVTSLVFAYASWRFFVSVDEVELADNLWGSTFGFYTYGILFPAWWALAKLGFAPDPNHWVIFGATLVAGAIAYGVRKWRAH